MRQRSSSRLRRDAGSRDALAPRGGTGKPEASDAIAAFVRNLGRLEHAAADRDARREGRTGRG